MSSPTTFEQKYPAITQWVEKYGWIEIGQDGLSVSLVRAIDEGGVVWEIGNDYQTVDQAMQAMDAALSIWIEDNYGVSL